MKASIVAACFLAFATAGRFGPEECVSLSRSKVGTCVLSTHCNGQDISHVEFGFDCEADSTDDETGDAITEITWHSFGVGGFEAKEEFDTEVPCTRCMVASPPAQSDSQPKTETPAPKAEAVHALHLRSGRAAAKTSRSPKRQAKRARKFAATPQAEGFSGPAVPGAISFTREERSEEVQFGPEDCVKVWKSTKGHCIMETDCAKSNMTGYIYGLVCVDKSGIPTRHLFGENSFLAEETFDTLISCESCLGLEEIPHEVTVRGEIAVLTEDMKELKSEVKNMSLDVKMLKTAVFPPAATAPPEEAAPTTTATLFAVEVGTPTIAELNGGTPASISRLVPLPGGPAAAVPALLPANASVAFAPAPAPAAAAVLEAKLEPPASVNLVRWHNGHRQHRHHSRHHQEVEARTLQEAHALLHKKKNLRRASHGPRGRRHGHHRHHRQEDEEERDEVQAEHNLLDGEYEEDNADAAVDSVSAEAPQQNSDGDFEPSDDA